MNKIQKYKDLQLQFQFKVAHTNFYNFNTKIKITNTNQLRVKIIAIKQIQSVNSYLLNIKPKLLKTQILQLLTLMEHSIKVHLNPMSNKKQFIKKSAKTQLSFITRPNLSFVTKPNSSFVGKTNLSATKTSNRLSFDKNDQTIQNMKFDKINTQRKWVNVQDNNMISHNQFLQENKCLNGITSYKIQKQRRQSLTENENIKRKRRSMYIKHRQKLKQILQFIDINNSLIQQIIDQDKQIDYYKKQTMLNQRKNVSFNLQKGYKRTSLNEQQKQFYWPKISESQKPCFTQQKK